MRRTVWRVVSLVPVLALAGLGCNSPNRGANTQPSAASGYRVEITASPNTLRGSNAGTPESQGGCASIRVTVFDLNNHLVDGVSVSIDTTLGRFPPVTSPPPGRPESVGVSGLTFRGIYTDTLCAKSERGTATVTATAEGATDVVFITIF
ncbi:MAG: hypothetical protein ACREMB_14935 [Candidatus Rokuibacteriota bacterium]